ncbi:hypothetical protein LFAB_16760 [Lactiplantibacillus fabifermentans T30PCM01]|uniref:Integral membrane protein n=1 Tax=Lactiplantibacillus fabifermentans T30PCM01 TaxID=1400520 RepID=W6T416_9LACO|nr:hypothetical protein [Lactiplantibacillus fabifermentans]ETY72534.1 hypothetical protein LFAB_16760 [Lactiplantibacillus fabifermentans T30PCM01]
MMKKYLVLAIAIVGTSFGSALGIKAAVGVTAWDAFAVTLGRVWGLKVGTVGMLLNTICFLLQVLLLKKGFKKTQYLQLAVTVLVGAVVNFALYDLLAFSLPTYALRIAMILASFVIMAFFTGIVMTINLITFPLEGLVLAIAVKTNADFARLRQITDIVLLVLCLVIPLTGSAELVVREGTVIGMLCFGPLLGWFMKYQKSILGRQQLLG